MVERSGQARNSIIDEIDRLRAEIEASNLRFRAFVVRYGDLRRRAMLAGASVEGEDPAEFAVIWRGCLEELRTKQRLVARQRSLIDALKAASDQDAQTGRPQ
jgi:hypothetical protein